MNAGNEIILLDSALMKTHDKWRTVNDEVMGGVSSSEVFINEDNKISFKGNVSLENNGGFASLRSTLKDYNFENFTGVEIKIKGDGKTFGISMKETTYFTGYFYRALFETKKDELLTINIPFEKFKLYYFGKTVNPEVKIPLNRIKEISLLISAKQEGAFNIEIDYIKIISELGD